MANPTIIEKVWDRHVSCGTARARRHCSISICIWCTKSTSPQAFPGLRERGLKVAGRTLPRHHRPQHPDTPIVRCPSWIRSPRRRSRNSKKNCRDFGIPCFGSHSAEQGIVHVIGPEQGLTQPGMTVVCGDSHTATHGAFGALAFGIGTSRSGARAGDASACCRRHRNPMRCGWTAH